MFQLKNNKFAFVDVAAIIFLIFITILVIIPKSINFIEKCKKQSFYKKTNRLIEKISQNHNEETNIYTYSDKVETSEIKLNYKNISHDDGKIIINKKGKVALALHNGRYCIEKDFLDKKMIITKKTKQDCQLPYNDNSDAFRPVLKENMIPIIYKDNKWVTADLNQAWYDYEKKEWANAILVEELLRDFYKKADPFTEINEYDVLAYFVWIPRYKYKLFNVEALAKKEKGIEISFELLLDDKAIGNNNDEWLTHPAFTFGKEELKGFWVGKFETTGRYSKPTIKPNLSALVHQNIGSQFEIAKKFNNFKTYGLSVHDETHMMKNTEWGAVAYLANSNYGKNAEIWVNPSKEFITGCAGNFVSSAQVLSCANEYTSSNGQEASTTGNVYGIYDMSGGTAEYVMGGLYNQDQTEIKLSLATFENINQSIFDKFIDKYQYGTTSNNQEAYNRRLLGDATSETRGWYSDTANFIMDSPSWEEYGNFWFTRGGYYNDKEKAGIFNFVSQDGGATSYNGFRVVLPGK